MSDPVSRLQLSRQEIDGVYAAAHPELVAAMMISASLSGDDGRGGAGGCGSAATDRTTAERPLRWTSPCPRVEAPLWKCRSP
jgi:hypothetical protein